MVFNRLSVRHDAYTARVCCCLYKSNKKNVHFGSLEQLPSELLLRVIRAIYKGTMIFQFNNLSLLISITFQRVVDQENRKNVSVTVSSLLSHLIDNILYASERSDNTIVYINDYSLFDDIYYDGFSLSFIYFHNFMVLSKFIARSTVAFLDKYYL